MVRAEGFHGGAKVLPSLTESLTGHVMGRLLQ